MRTIDADTLTRQIVITIEDSCMNALWKQGMNYALGLVKVQPTIQSELSWIPVEQDLPKIGEYVLCETTTRYFGKYHVCKFVDKDKWVDKPHFDWDRNGFPHVIAWTRFEPYKEVTE